MVITDDADPVSVLTPRLCILKREEGESFGFRLRVERGCHGHVIRQVTASGVADCSGLKDGDRLLEVNESFVVDFTHLELAMRIKLSGNQLCLLVLDGEVYDQAVLEGHDLQAIARAHRGVGYSPPRLFHITRDTHSGFGVNFLPLEGQKGQFLVSVVRGGSAERAGVCQGDRLLWIDGAAVSDLSHRGLSKVWNPTSHPTAGPSTPRRISRVKKCRDHMTILVIDMESEKSYAHRRMPILPTMARSYNLPYRPRKLHLALGSEGYGFLLREEKTPSGRKAHVMREVDHGSPAEEAGMQEGDELLEVNGREVESLAHKDIVDRIRKSGQQVSLTIITSCGQQYYKQLGLSALLLFYGTNENLALHPVVAVEVPKEQPAVWPTKPSPRLCIFEKGPPKTLVEN
ncbi:hypothetical protein UPYG_G00113800 [Umbra pygmaea]|uniref:PDZ domain-containing protein n=1 Tax=Umbra pygmaea TaxID=75934 RepID=A0ABD0XNM0_UMBPY